MNFINLLKEAKEDKPSKGLSKEKKSAVAKKAKAGKDIGKKGKGFEKVAAKAAKQYGSKEAGERVAAAAMWKNIQREGAGQDHEVSMAVNSLKSIMQSVSALMEKLGEQERNIPGWIQDHITNAENYLDQAAQGFHEIEGGLDEKKLTGAEKNKKEQIVKSMAKEQGGKSKLQGKDYAIATSQAIKSA